MAPISEVCCTSTLPAHPIVATVYFSGDALKLHRDFGILCRSVSELGALARLIDPEFAQAHNGRRIVSLKEMVQVYLQKELLKGEAQTSNWETKPLSSVQLTCE